MDENKCCALSALVMLIAIFVILFFVIRHDMNKQEAINKTLSEDQLVTKRFGIEKINYEGHSYIMMSRGKYLNGICHDENCKCRIK